MKAVVCTKYGPPEVLEIREVEKPSPKDHEVLIRIHATTISAADFRLRSFTIPASYWLPARIGIGFFGPRKPILGSELSGEIEEIGSKVTRFKQGDKIVANTDTNFGAHATYRCMTEDDCIVLKPANATYHRAAPLSFGGLTALGFLRKAGVQPGQKVLIYGASGAVGSAAVQLASHMGAEVTAVCSWANLDLVKSLGATKAIDYTTTDFSKDGPIYDVVFDAVGKSSLKSSLQALKPGGKFAHSVATPGVSLRLLFTRGRRGKKFIGGSFKSKAENLRFMADLVEEGHFKPVIDRQYPIDQIVAAHQYVDQGHKIGNVVITIP